MSGEVEHAHLTKGDSYHSSHCLTFRQLQFESGCNLDFFTLYASLHHNWPSPTIFKVFAQPSSTRVILNCFYSINATGVKKVTLSQKYQLLNNAAESSSYNSHSSHNNFYITECTCILRTSKFDPKEP